MLFDFKNSDIQIQILKYRECSSDNEFIGRFGGKATEFFIRQGIYPLVCPQATEVGWISGYLILLLICYASEIYEDSPLREVVFIFFIKASAMTLIPSFESELSYSHFCGA